MANRHYGEIGDVWKHLPLAEMLSIERPAAYWESHAGSAQYALTHTPNHDYGVGHFLRHAGAAPALAASAYYRLLVRMAHGRAPGLYPGSPYIAMQVLSDPACQFVCCDIDLGSLASINAVAGKLGKDPANVHTVGSDGVAALLRMLSSLSDAEANGTFLHVDPYQPLAANADGRSPAGLFIAAAQRGVRSMLWFGFDTRAQCAEVVSRLDQAATRRLWMGTIVLEAIDAQSPVPANPGVFGCGIVLANLSAESLHACQRLGKAMEGIYRTAVLPGGVPGALRFSARWLG